MLRSVDGPGQVFYEIECNGFFLRMVLQSFQRCITRARCAENWLGNPILHAKAHSASKRLKLY